MSAAVMVLMGILLLWVVITGRARRIVSAVLGK